MPDQTPTLDLFMIQHRQRDGFSLVEILVSVAIVAVLAVLLLPVLEKARKKAVETQCLGRLRNVGTALASFVADNNGMVPPRTVQTPSVPVNPPEEQRYWTSRLVLGGYITDRNVLYCPGCFPYRDSLATKKLEDDGGQTYGMRVWVPAGMDWNLRWKDQPLAAIESPANFFLVADSIWLDWSQANGKSTQGYGLNPTGSSGAGQNQRIHLRHFNRANALFADFHVESKPDSYFVDEVWATQAAYSNNNRFYVQEDDTK